MVKTYSKKKDGNIKLTPNFSVWEFACNDGTDTILIDTDVVNSLQKDLRNLAIVLKIVIASGYRTVAYNQKIGGSATGPHTQGKAVDFTVYDKNNKIIPAKYICCYLQDLGYLRIEQISANNTHFDLNWSTTKMRLTKTGQVNGKNTYQDIGDFYTYNKCTKEEVYKALGLNAPTNSPTKFNSTRVLKKGLKGDDVKQLQKELIARGYKLIGGADGVFGNSTFDNLKQFQKAQKMKSIDGMAGPEVSRYLNWLYNGK